MAYDPSEVNQKGLSAILSLSTRQIRNLDEQGLPGSRVDPDTQQRIYDPTVAVPWYIRRVKDKLKSTEKDLADLEVAKAKAALAQLELAEREGKLIPMELHVRLLTDVLSEVRSRFKNLAGSAAPYLIGLDQEHEVVETLDPLVNQSLEAVVRMADELEEMAEDMEAA